MTNRNECCNELAKELKEAKRLLAHIAAHAVATATPAAAELGRGEIPRGRYAYLKARVETCNDILGLMGLPQVAIKQRRAMFGKGLFSGFLGNDV